MMSTGTELKRIRCSYKGRTGYIPEIWLAGRSQVWQREGLTAGDAYTQAIIDWFEQSDLATEYNRQQPSDRSTNDHDEAIDAL
jgi:hypothetical protein